MKKYLLRYIYLISAALLLFEGTPFAVAGGCEKRRSDILPDPSIDYWKGQASRWPTYGSVRNHPNLSVPGMLDQGPEKSVIANILFEKDPEGALRIVRFDETKTEPTVSVPDGVLKMPTEHWRCLLKPGDIAYISDGFTDHTSQIYRLDDISETVYFSDPRASESFLLKKNSPLMWHDGTEFLDEDTGIRGVFISYENFKKLLIEAIVINGEIFNQEIADHLSNTFKQLNFWDLIYWQSLNVAYGPIDPDMLQLRFKFLDQINAAANQDAEAKQIIKRETMSQLRRILLFRRLIFLKSHTDRKNDNKFNEILKRTLFYDPASLGLAGRLRVIKDLYDGELNSLVLDYYDFMLDSGMEDLDATVLAYSSCGYLVNVEADNVNQKKCMEIRERAYPVIISRLSGIVPNGDILEKVKVIYNTPYVSQSIRLTQLRLATILATDQVFGKSKNLWSIYKERYKK